MKEKFIQSFDKFKKIFKSLNEDGMLSIGDAKDLNEFQLNVVNYFHYMEGQLNPIITVDLPWKEPEFKEAWIQWKKYHKTKTKAYTNRGEQMALTHLYNMSEGNLQTAIDALKYSELQTWTGIFLDKSKKKINNSTGIDHKKEVFKRLTNG